MTATEFKAFIDKNGLRAEDVAHETGLGITTVYRFLRGATLSRMTVKVLAAFVASKEQVSPQTLKGASGVGR